MDKQGESNETEILLRSSNKLFPGTFQHIYTFKLKCPSAFVSHSCLLNRRMDLKRVSVIDVEENTGTIYDTMINDSHINNNMSFSDINQR